MVSAQQVGLGFITPHRCAGSGSAFYIQIWVGVCVCVSCLWVLVSHFDLGLFGSRESERMGSSKQMLHYQRFAIVYVYVLIVWAGFDCMWYPTIGDWCVVDYFSVLTFPNAVGITPEEQTVYSCHPMACLKAMLAITSIAGLEELAHMMVSDLFTVKSVELTLIASFRYQDSMQLRLSLRLQREYWSVHA